MEVVIDVQNGRVRLGRQEFRGQWVDFYALLSLARTAPGGAGELVSARDVARVGPWRHKLPKSVGKEVSRHLGRLSGEPSRGLVASGKRTVAWGLDVPQSGIVFVPDRRAVEEWVRSRSLATGGASDWIEDLQALVEASIALQKGAAETALAALQRLSTKLADASPQLSAWCAVLAGKAADQHDEEDDALLHELHDRWKRRGDPLGKAVSARLRAVLARRYRFTDPKENLASLTKLAAELETSGDLGGLGAVLNVAGLLSRRAGDVDAAIAHHLRAAALFGITSDYTSLQAAVFNLAICRAETAKARGEPPDPAVLALVDLNRQITSAYGVGGDSAQAEIAGAAWSCEMGDLNRARRYLEQAEELLATIEATYDHAYFRETRAQIELTQPTGRTDPVNDLKAAADLYRSARDQASSKRVRERLTTISPSRPVRRRGFGRDA